MMNKKYTVFISSTYTDLKEERQKILDVVLQSDCIPVGMEYFPAADDEQFNIIKKLIDDCDFYILIIGGRYGSINNQTKISYTEMEYDYAITQKIPILVFEHKDIKSLPENKRDVDKEKLIMLEAFKQKARGSRMAKMWDTHEELLSAVIISLNKAKSDHNRPGWTRGGNYDNSELLIQLNKIKIEKEYLEKQIIELNNKLMSYEKEDKELAFYGEKVTLNFTEIHYVWTSNTVFHEIKKVFTLDEIFKAISIRLTAPTTNSQFVENFAALASGYAVDSQQALPIKTQFAALGLIESEIDKKNIEYIKLTQRGIKIMNELNTIKKNSGESV